MRLAAFQEHDGRLHEAPMGPEWFMYLEAGMPERRGSCRLFFSGTDGARWIAAAHRAMWAWGPEAEMFFFARPSIDAKPALNGDEMALARFMVLDSGYAWARRWLGDLCSP